MRRWLAALLGLLLLSVLAAGAGWLYLGQLVRSPGPAATALRLTVQPGQNLRQVLGQLEAEGALRHRRAVELWLRLGGAAPRVKAGTYEIPPGASVRSILDQLAEGRVVLESLTVVEGATFADFRRALAAHPRVRQTLGGADDAAVMAALGHPGEHPEGRFFPDTFRFADGTTDREILDLAYRQMRRELDAAWAARSTGLPLRSDHEALVLASIVEKETALASERPRVAGVYTTRLRRGMRLQSDPTVIYGIGPAYDGDIRNRDLERDTPYNTYTRAGLPPTPIALPGRDALRAAVRPLETGAVFFVATGEPDGSHVFSATYDEHRAAVARMLTRQRQRGLQRSGASP
jgi:UPF0755 protein